MMDALDGIGIPAWLSYTVDGDRTRAGQPLADAFALAADRPDVIAVGVNCSAPYDATAAVTVAAEERGNQGPYIRTAASDGTPETRRWTGPALDPTASVTRWIADGARLVGGCCRVTPAAIAGLATTVASTPDG